MDFNESILETYNLLKIRFPSRFDSFSVVNAVMNHRNYWKPDKIKTILLAESHVYTTDQELAIKLRYPGNDMFDGIPDEFVKLVYCLGYGESSLAPSLAKNPGTPQYWKIFTACASDTSDIDFGPILKCATGNDQERIENKVALLKKLRMKGVWLLDASIIGLYDSGSKVKNDEMEFIIPFCWDNYIARIVESEKPGHIIVIGYKVATMLWERLCKTRIPFTKLPQPQARLSAEEHNEALRTYQRICNRIE